MDIAKLRSRRWVRVLLWVQLGVTALLALIVLGLATPPGRAVLARLVERGASSNGLTVVIGRLSGWPPFYFGADRIVVSDLDGPFAEVENLGVDLRMAALLHGGVEFNAITADRLAFARRPRLAAQTPPSENSVALAVDRFAVTRLELGADVAGKPAVLATSGTFASGSNGSLDLNAKGERTDGTAGKLDASIHRDRRDAPLAVDVHVEEGANGILIGALGRPDGPGYRLDARTAVNGEIVGGSISLSSTGNAQFEGRFTLSPVAGARRLQLVGGGDLAELLPAAYIDLLTGPIAVDVDADWRVAAAGQALPHIVIRKGTVRTAGIDAQASGTLDDATANLTLKMNVGKPNGGVIALPAAQVRLDNAALSANVTRVADGLRLDVAGRIDNLHVAESSVPRTDLAVSVTSAGRDPFAGGKLPYTLRLEAAAVDTPAGRIPAGGGAPLVATAEGTFDTATAVSETRAALAIEGGRATFAGTLGDTEGHGTLTAAFPDLRPLARFIGSPLSGKLDATAEGALYSRTGADLKVQGSMKDVDIGTPALARLLAGRTQIAGNVVRRTDGTVSVSGLSIDGAALQATGKAAVGATTIDVALEGRLANLALLADASTGAAHFSVNASGARNGPTIDATIRVDKGTLVGKPMEQASARLQGKPSDAGWAGTVALDGNFAGKRMAGSANAALDRRSGLLAFPRIDLAIGANRISGALQRTAQGPLTGTLNVAAPDVATLAALALFDATGAADARVAFTANGARQGLAITFSGTRLAYATVAAGKIDGDASIDDAWGTPRIRGTATAAAMTVGALKLDNAKASATIEGALTRFTAAAQGPDLDLSGSGSYGAGAAGSREVRIATLAGSAYKLPVRLAAPSAIRIAGDNVTLVGTQVMIGGSGGGSVRVDGALAPDFNLIVIADKVTASTANIFSPGLGAEGTVSGRAAITGKPSAVAFGWQVDATGLRAAATRKAGLPPLALSARGDATTAGTSVDARVTGAGGLAFTVNGQVPYSGAGLAVRAEGSAPLALLALESSRELRLAGSARVNVSATGAIDAPQLSGTADLVDATVVDADTGFGVAGAKGRILFDGKQATLQQISGRLAQGGQITLGGTIDVVGPGLPAALTVRVDNGRYADGRVINVLFDANLAIKGPLLTNGTVSGTVALGRTEIQLPEKLGGARTAIDVRHVNAPPTFKSPQPRREAGDGTTRAAPDSSLRLAVEVTNSRGIFVRGFGVDAEFGGTVRVNGTVGDPRAAGDFTMRRGRIEVLGKRFDLVSGTLTFAGDLVPLVEFKATAATTTATVTVNVTGPADDPKIKFTSSPDLPQEEVLSRILFERSVGSLSPLQAAQLIDAIAQFTGVGGSGGIFGRIRQATGLDDVDVRQNATGGTTVGVSKSVSDNVRLGVEAGSGTAAGRVTVDLELSKNLKARGEAGQDGSGKIGITYEREY